MQSGESVGLIPTHPLDARGKTPINLQEGVFPVSHRGVSDPVQATTAENWKNLHKGPGRDFLPSESVGITAPVRVVRSMAGGGSATGVVATNRESGIAFDPAEHRFVNSSVGRSTERTELQGSSGTVSGDRRLEAGASTTRNSAKPGSERWISAQAMKATSVRNKPISMRSASRVSCRTEWPLRGSRYSPGWRMDT